VSFPETMSGGTFRGRLKALSSADILEFLRVLNRKGVLTLATEGATINLFLRSGAVVHATSTRASDRLTEVLMRSGRLTHEQYEDTMRRAAAGETIGHALVSGGHLTPRDLTEARRSLVRQITLSLFEWDSGVFDFVEGEESHEEGLEVHLPITDLIVEGIRGVRTSDLFRQRMTSLDCVFESIAAEERKIQVVLEPHEAHVLRLVDSHRTIGAIVEMAEFPEQETLRVLFLLSAIGYVKVKTRTGPDVEEESSRAGIAGIVDGYNHMFGQVYQYLMREIGPISEHLLLKSLREMEGAYPALFRRATLGGDGTVDAALLQDNLQDLNGAPKRETLIQGLNELLYAELLVLRKTLGPEHEARILKRFRERPAGPPLGR
jgi:uncharacterized protein DUF4388